ncbi:hypothetical protein [Mesonia sp. HuA40]|uniref:hypothetical protein n=1 Tax=Mesonia sp. HuA40 TaxID=2602761 RepID=UPI0011CAA887|nr:hypothetical protein [Mesonia sp. HuA40]TXK73955.1 hypothetical protein FT993_03595 [Mesonia sp. HuA40]
MKTILKNIAQGGLLHVIIAAILFAIFEKTEDTHAIAAIVSLGAIITYVIINWVRNYSKNGWHYFQMGVGVIAAAFIIIKTVL